MGWTLFLIQSLRMNSGSLGPLMDGYGLRHRETIFIPFFVAVLSAVVLGLQTLLSKLRPKVVQPGAAQTTEARWLCLIRIQRGSTMFSIKMLRLGLLYALFALSFWENVISPRGQTDEANAWLELLGYGPGISLTATYWYTAILATASILSSRWKDSLARHCTVVLLGTWATLAYRDVWPLATFNLSPQDHLDLVFWIQFSLLSVSAVVIPIFIPREYVPLNPKNPQKDLHPEQTASIASLLFHSFNDAIIRKASKTEHLPVDRLPVLPDYDDAAYLRERAYPHMDPFKGAKRRHLFFSLIAVLREEYTMMSLAIIVYCFAAFTPPMAIKGFLAYIETDGRDATVRPWIWITLMFLGPLVTSLSLQWYLYYAAAAVFRVEAMLVQLILEHSLRIRLKSDSDGADSEPNGGSGKSDAETSSESQGGTGTDSVIDVSSQTEGSVSKGKGKASTASAEDQDGDDGKGTKKDNLIGKINTLITVDLGNIVDAKDWLTLALQVPLQGIIALAFLYQILGWSAILGLVSIVALMPIPGYLANVSQGIQVKKLEKTDARVQTVGETIGVLRMIKLFGWEPRMKKLLSEKRNEELRWVWRGRVMQAALDIVNRLIPDATMILTYATYVVVMKQPLSASKVFASMTAFDILRGLLWEISWCIDNCVRAKVSLERIQGFLHQTELLDRYDAELNGSEKTGNVGPLDVATATHGEEVIGFSNVTFAWSKEDKPSSSGTMSPTPTSQPKRKHRQFRLRIDGTLLFQRGGINLVVGPTGSGKTSVLMALLGEMHQLSPAESDSPRHSWFNLPRAGGVAYAAQESWVQNESIRSNILFGEPYDEERYRKVIYQCALQRDLELFEAGDATEVGEKGLTLSGGQKARVILARAIYSLAQIILLDDILAALDVHTSKWIVDKCLKGDLIAGRTVILITHNIALTQPIANFIVAVDRDGRVQGRGLDIGTITNIQGRQLQSEQSLEQEIAIMPLKSTSGSTAEQMTSESTDVLASTDQASADGKLVLAEEVALGRVSWKTFWLYLHGLSRFPVLFASGWFTLSLLTQGLTVFSTYFIGQWGAEYNRKVPEDVAVAWWLGRYSSILILSLVFYGASTCFFYAGTIRASRKINALLVDSVLRSTLRWLDETPTGRILTRCTQDIAAIDKRIPMALSIVVEIFLSTIIRLVGPVILNPIILLFGAVILIVGIVLANIYLKAQMSVKRNQTVAKAPVLSHVGTTVAGLVSIRAYSAQRPFMSESLKRVSHYARLSKTCYNLNRWMAIRTDLLGAAFTATLASYLLLRSRQSAAVIGFSLTMSLDLCSKLLFLVRFWNELEVQSNSLERIQAYLEIEYEPQAVPEGVPPASWPTCGDLSVEKLSAKYSSNGPLVLQDLSFSVKSGERVGIVGRTGSGKSSLTLALLRCIITGGTVRYDGIDTSKINLDSLRSSVTIIPQMPELLSGTLRRNLDPFDQHDDATLNSALRASGLFDLQDVSDDARLTLDSTIASGGGNLSVGQRQIIALARAIVRNSKLLILDEATSAIDHRTDAIIQTTLRQELSSDVTILTVAHRLQTIMDADKVMVLDAGRIVEYDAPSVLLSRDGVFKAMVDGSGDKDALRAMVSK